VVPELSENCTPDTPTPGVNGQVVGSPASQDSRSMLSLAPAARIRGPTGLTASAGSFCLFCEKIVSLLPTVTSVSGVNAYAGAAASAATSTASSAMSTTRGLLSMSPPLDLGGHLPTGGAQSAEPPLQAHGRRPSGAGRRQPRTCGGTGIAGSSSGSGSGRPGVSASGSTPAQVGSA
jgi:hypothetical protein